MAAVRLGMVCGNSSIGTKRLGQALRSARHLERVKQNLAQDVALTPVQERPLDRRLEVDGITRRRYEDAMGDKANT